MTYNCSWCSRSAQRGTDYDGTPNGWVWNKPYGLGRKVFCSNKCLNEHNASEIQSGNQKSEMEARKAEAKLEEAILKRQKQEEGEARKLEEARQRAEEAERKREEAIKNNPFLGKFDKFNDAFAKLREREADWEMEKEVKFNSSAEKLKRIEYLKKNEFNCSDNDIDGF